MNTKDIFAKRLKCARVMAGISMDTLAQRIDRAVTQQALQKYEAGVMTPQEPVLLAIANVLNRPPEYFYRPFGVQVESVEFCRKLNKTPLKEIKAAKATITDTLTRYLALEDYLNVYTPFHNPIQSISIHATTKQNREDIEDAAQALRSHWLYADSCITNCLAFLEDNGIKIVLFDQLPGGHESLAAFANGTIPVIALRKMEDGLAMRYWALVALGSLVLSVPETYDAYEKDDICQYFAGAMLLPKAVLEREIGANRKHISIVELSILSAKYGVSTERVAVRASQTGIIHAQFSKKYREWQSRNAEQLHHHQTLWGKFHADERLTRFDSLLHRAVAEEFISYDEAAALKKQSIQSLDTLIQAI